MCMRVGRASFAIAVHKSFKNHRKMEKGEYHLSFRSQMSASILIYVLSLFLCNYASSRIIYVGVGIVTIKQSHRLLALQANFSTRKLKVCLY
jgi:hypothetical protein